ncbi:MAG: sulfate reduction electron transfer complex DsrMKJOP subunit DsrM [Deltaproteobacteria bacterium]|nr:sulfate reduction electron transfer complex DsrMKJOP subunit DsrM [Deltaproteobacteria bacterium]
MGMLFSLFAVLVLVAISFVGVRANLHGLFGVAVPYAAVFLFLAGFIWKVIKWGKSPVPFHIPTTCGQQKSLPWIKHSKLDNPSSTPGVIGRMALEIVLFRSLFRNIKTEMRDGTVTYGSNKWLWLGSLAFHVSFFVVLVRHLRFFTEPVPFLVNALDAVDGFMQVGVPHLLMTGVVLLVAAGYLVLRRILNQQVKYISLAADYFPLFLIIGIALSGILMRYFIKVDIVKVKELTMGLASFNTTVPEGIGTIFYVHLFLISVLFAYFPFSKLMHLGGIFLSPTRNLINNSRAVRHVNPWNPEVHLHTYAEYEDEFREVMKEQGIPVEKE